MSTSRKVQSDIEKTLKLMNAGFTEFEEIRQKLDETPAGHQKEKVEAELKRSLKRLQKYREQIKGWLQTEIKNKRTLEEAKRDIEIRMEAFKEIERESKIKPYSIEGLARVSESEETEDEEVETTWVDEAIERLEEQIEELKKEKEPVKKKKQSQQKKNQLQKRIELNSKHIEKLKTINEAFKYGFLTEEDLSELQDDVDMYLEQTGTNLEDSLHIYNGFDFHSLTMQIEEEKQEQIENAERKRKEEEEELAKEELKEKELEEQQRLKQQSEVQQQTSPVIQQKLSPKQQSPAVKVERKVTKSPTPQETPKTPKTNVKGKAQDSTKLQKKSSNEQVDTVEEKKEEKGQVDEKTLKTLQDIEFSYTNMMSQSPTIQKHTPAKSQLPKWFPTQASEFSFTSNKIDDEFLMFLFYYTQGTPLQAQAAERLRQKKWVFHKGYQKWFRKVNDNGFTSNVSENGDYCCFDFESWNIESKTHFAFFNNFMEK
ncbi:hypothetical protein EIN_047190 [Entamoeba invadens IP1]|uniref:CCR4-NOT transcription complex subunit 3 n=1 Tax=Entamoeba invadens IP1 TaxID=370355 RepID=A0A0A1UDM1_ENTIV|nr:hypothetical protein EIN_047190 [Entamoeba invadens IP1]ELP94436.1 hypothetical protein EIN_047190 [Entamoeba invadens IP1]|eukprot:XP_004261207.1 hypothetical protein EIN_047190 [Entamoeba invadens IP1]